MWLGQISQTIRLRNSFHLYVSCRCNVTWDILNRMSSVKILNCKGAYTRWYMWWYMHQNMGQYVYQYKCISIRWWQYMLQHPVCDGTSWYMVAANEACLKMCMINCSTCLTSCQWMFSQHDEHSDCLHPSLWNKNVKEYSDKHVRNKIYSQLVAEGERTISWHW